jgi:hypothetical protein
VINMNWIRSDIRFIPRRIGSFYCIRRPFLIGTLGYVVLGTAIAVFMSGPVTAQDVNNNSETGLKQENSANSTQQNYAGVSYISSNLRDPFLNPLLKNKESTSVDQEIDLGLPPPGISGTYIEEATLQGISIKENDGCLAIVKGSGNRVFFLREGSRLFDGYLKVIHRDSITFVRERKMRSGKILTQEVIKRLRTP